MLEENRAALDFIGDGYLNRVIRKAMYSVLYERFRRFSRIILVIKILPFGALDISPLGRNFTVL